MTLADLKLGRGIDIRVSIDIPGGLHVVIGTEVVHKRLLKQMIGRTGRLGREGSYSIIVMDRVITQPSVRGDETWMGALHLISGLGAHYLLETRVTLTGEARREWVRKWLLFLQACRSKSTATSNFVERAHLTQLIPLEMTAGSAGAAGIRARLQKELGGEPL